MIPGEYLSLHKQNFQCNVLKETDVEDTMMWLPSCFNPNLGIQDQYFKGL